MTVASEIVKDHARRALEGMPLSAEDKANLWDSFYAVDSPSDLAHIFSRLPAEISQPLVDAKKFSTLKAVRPEDEFAMRHVLKAMAHMVTIDPELLDLFERHPQVFRHFIQTAVR